jgi:RNA polymerase sigma-70 factor (ECF subfamily)
MIRDPFESEPISPDRFEAARRGSISDMGILLESARQYLELVASQSSYAGLEGKVPQSDLVQQTLMEALRDFKTFRGQSRREFNAWLRRILLHNLANARRQFAAAKRDVRRELPLDAVSGPHARERSPSSLVARQEISFRVEDAIGRQSPEYQKVIRLRSLQRLSFEAIGDQMARTAGAARKLWFRAVQKLKEELSGDTGGTSVR